MADLLIHSMAEFWPVIEGALHIAEARDIVEIGAEFGGMSERLAAHAEQMDGRLTCIDPAPMPQFLDWVSEHREVRHVAEPSLSAIDGLDAPDAWFVDGDHNWYTVYHELQAIDRVTRAAGKPMLVFFHDVGWPWGRRDLYYAPDRIPAEYRHPYSYEDGVTLGRSSLLPGGGFRGCGAYACARHEGGPRNGVLTAIEDFRAEAGRDLVFAEVPAVFGLGILFDATAPWAEALGRALLPYHKHPLLASLEQNRLANYLRVIALQDEIALKEAA
jgi:hypothetical protein